jgi:hypothetical protein
MISFLMRRVAVFPGHYSYSWTTGDVEACFQLLALSLRLGLLRERGM